jgi:opacity protein-like surface antigen
MLSRSTLLIALVAASAAVAAAQATQGQSFYSKVASCVAREVKNEAVSRVAGAVGLAQAGTDKKKDTVDFYTVGFTPGIGCFMASIITKNVSNMDPTGPEYVTRYDPGEQQRPMAAAQHHSQLGKQR